MIRNKGFTHIIAIVGGFILIAVIVGIFSIKNIPKSAKETIKKTTPFTSHGKRWTDGPRFNTAFSETSTVSNTACGIVVTSPKSNQSFLLASSVITLSGIVSGCDWEPVQGQIGIAYIVDNKKIPISSTYPIPVTTTTDGKYSFSVLIQPLVPYDGVGYVVLENMPPSGKTLKTLSIPIGL
jgi:hypothetical protein